VVCTCYICPRKSIRWLLYWNIFFVQIVNRMMVLGLWQNMYLWSAREGSVQYP